MRARRGLRGAYVVRQAGTLVGGAIVMAGAGLTWLANYAPRQGAEELDISPFHLSVKWLWQPGSGTDADPVKSMGMLLLILVGVIVFGLVTAGRGITVTGGAAALAVALAFAFTISRSQRPFTETVGLGVWLTAAGGLVAAVGALLGSSRRY